MSDEDGRTVSRREFLKIAGLAGATVAAGAGLGGVLAACGGTEETTTTGGATTTAGVTTTAGATTTTAAASTTTVSAGAEAGRAIKIGALSPMTGALASFGGPDKWIVSVVQKAVKDGVVCGDGKNHPIEIMNMDTQSNPDRVAQVTGDLIFNSKVDMVAGVLQPGYRQPGGRAVRGQRRSSVGQLRALAGVLFRPGRHSHHAVQVDLDVPLRSGGCGRVPDQFLEPDTRPTRRWLCSSPTTPTVCPGRTKRPALAPS